MPKIRVIGQMVQTGEHTQTNKRTHTHTDATKRIISPATWSINTVPPEEARNMDTGNIHRKFGEVSHMVLEIYMNRNRHTDMFCSLQHSTLLLCESKYQYRCSCGTTVPHNSTKSSQQFSVECIHDCCCLHQNYKRDKKSNEKVNKRKSVAFLTQYLRRILINGDFVRIVLMLPLLLLRK